MSQPLAKVTGELDGPRGPDVELQITVPATWFGSSVEVELPRNLNCAHCQGGGCDRCDRAGALSLRERDAEAKRILVALPAHSGSAGGQTDLCIRIPGQGAHSAKSELGPGHLLLKIQAGPDLSPCVSLVAQSGVLTAEQERLQLMRRSVVMAVGLILLFIGLLRLSGWL